jgi:MFS family permease
LWLQAAALALTGLTGAFAWWLPASALLGVGTAMVYPSLIAAVSDAAHPRMRARALSLYRFWRDLGYAVGALTSGVIADIFGFEAAILAIAALTAMSGGIGALMMRDRSR